MMRAFTLLELLIVIAILGIMAPIVAAVGSQLEDNQLRALDKLDAARSAREVSESLRVDLATHRFDRAMALQGPCGALAYVVDERQVLWRRAPEKCGGDRALASRVAHVSRRGGLVEIAFSHRRAGDEPTLDVFRLGFAGSTSEGTP